MISKKKEDIFRILLVIILTPITKNVVYTNKMQDHTKNMNVKIKNKSIFNNG